MTTTSSEKRRPIHFRNTQFAIKTSKWLAAKGFKPNFISLMSVVFSAFAALCLFFSAYLAYPLQILLFLTAVFFILMRLFCNLFDGMLAVECGLYSKSGEVYNDFPDRPSDILILVAAGYAARTVYGGIELGWVAAILAVLTAYVRLLGGAAGAKQYFIGPMAKQHRMALIMIACFLAIIFNAGLVFSGALCLIILGSLITIVRRLKRIVIDLEEG